MKIDLNKFISVHICYQPIYQNIKFASGTSQCQKDEDYISKSLSCSFTRSHESISNMPEL